MGALASLVGYVFYGFIELKAIVSTMDSKQAQVVSEQRDLWDKYNDDAMNKVEFMREYYGDRVDDEKRWGVYWKEKYEELK